MIKKMMAHSFILIAGIIMLTHDIVPHHHHEAEAIEQSQTYSSHADKDHQHFPKHEHPQDDNLFVIRQAFVLSPSIGQLLDSNDGYCGNNGFDYFFFHPPTFLFVYTPPYYKIPIGDNTPHFPNSVTVTIGSRAPPTA